MTIPALAPRSRRSVLSWASVLALVGVLAAVAVPQVSAKHNADHVPANKVAVAGSTTEVAGPNEEVVLLETRMRNAASKSLVLQVTLECSILTDLTTTGSATARAESTLEVWVVVDDGVNERVVGVDDSENGEGFGEVTFCNREYQRETVFLDDEDHIIDDFIRTKQAHGFNWVDLDTGNGVQDIKVMGRLSTDTTGTATAEVVVGNRTLIVDPVDTAHGETRDN